MPPLFHFEPSPNAPHIDRIHPRAAMPGGDVEVYGRNLGPAVGRSETLPSAAVGDTRARILLSRSTRALIQIPEGSITGELVVHHEGQASNGALLQVAVPMAENLHPVANPAVDPNGDVYATLSGSRGQQMPVSIFKIERDFQLRPFVRDLLNPTGLAFDAAGYLYASSRAEGTVYRISPAGAVSIYAEGMGIATGIAFDHEGNLYVGDRSGTIFKIGKPDAMGSRGEIFVYATLEPSFVAYHLAFNDAGILFVTGPTTSSNQAIHAIDRDGDTTVFYQGLGRAQGMAFDIDGNLYVAASLHGQRGIACITPDRQAALAVSGPNLIGLAFLEGGNAALATRDTLYHVSLGVEGRSLF